MPEYQDFDLDRSTAQAWQEFEDRLAEVVSLVDDSADLTIGSLAGNDEQAPYVRFRSVDRDTLRAEASSNAELGEHYQLTASQLARLAELGWASPVSEGEQAGTNFWFVHPQEDSARFAALSVQTLRDVFGVQHPAFLSPDHLAGILQPADPLTGESPYDAEDVVATIPVNSEHLQDMVERELTEMFGHPPLHDAEGDIAIRVGSTMLFLRLSADGREVILFATVVHELEGRSRAMEVISDLNADARMVKFLLIRDRVFVAMSVLAHPFVPAHLHQAVKMLSEVADGVDDDLAAKLHGRTTFAADDR